MRASPKFGDIIPKMRSIASGSSVKKQISLVGVLRLTVEGMISYVMCLHVVTSSCFRVFRRFEQVAPELFRWKRLIGTLSTERILIDDAQVADNTHTP